MRGQQIATVSSAHDTRSFVLSVVASVKPTETKRTTCVTSRAPLPSNVSPEDRRLVERFRRDQSRYPKSPDDGDAYWALVRGRSANLAAQAQTPALPGESSSTTKWRRESAAKALVRISRSSHTARGIVRRAVASTRPRERSDSPRRGGPTSLGGDGGDRPRSSDDDVARPAPAVSNGDARLSPAELRSLILEADLGQTVKLVGLVLTVHMERGCGTGTPSHPKLMRETGLSLSSVKRAVARLERAQLIEYERGGGGKPAHYRTTGFSRTPVRRPS
jgi:hypothetical protein